MSLWTFLRGSAEITFRAKNPEKLLNALKDRVTLSDVERVSDGQMRVTVFYGERNIFEEELGKRKAEITEMHLSGLPYILYKSRNRWGLAVGFVLALFAVCFSSLFVWEIRVEGVEKVDADEIVEVLESVGFHEGVYKKGVDIQSVINRFLIKEGRISWIMINFDGTVAHVELKEAKRPSLVPKKENVNLVAGHNGIIIRADTLEGSCQVTRGETVTKGQMLISAFVDRKDGSSSLRGARGYVWAETLRRYSVSVPLSYTVKEYTGKERKEYEITFLGKSINFERIFSPQTGLTDMTVEKRKFRPFTQRAIPIHITSKTFREYTETSVARSEKEALEIARNKAIERLKKDSPTFVVAGEEKRYEVREGILFAEFDFSGVENIARELEFGFVDELF